MKRNFKELERRQLLEKLNTSLSKAASLTRPSKGWVRTTRKALGMTMVQLAQRLGVRQSRIAEIETAEMHDQLTLKTLRATAEALGCRFEYVFIPEKPIEAVLKEKAIKLAQKKIQYVSHHMVLEDQETRGKEQENQIQELAEELLKSPQNLWKEYP